MKLYAIVDLAYTHEPIHTCLQLIRGGADIIQLRAKNHPEDSLLYLAHQLLTLCRTAKIPFIINDFPHLAAAIEADGVHIGQNDGSYAQTRDIVGPNMLIGRSTHSLTQAQQALTDGFSYIGFGPLFPTPTKPGRPAIGLHNIHTMEQTVGCHIPAFCIGGITPQTLPTILAHGARRIVAVSALLQAPDITAATQSLRNSLP